MVSADFTLNNCFPSLREGSGLPQITHGIAAFQTLVALAKSENRSPDEPPYITKDHVAEIVNLAKHFKLYLNKMYKGLTIEQVAAREGVRAEDVSVS